uniref:Uncharacterized protein n=1 Tax=Anguilla anguilla TaxID=7936 RepID=A0A0E9S8A9_ANGAN
MNNEQYSWIKVLLLKRLQKIKVIG